MASPFPGMDPYLEHPEIWPGVHHFLITALAGLLAPQLRPKYLVAAEVRVYETTGEQSLVVGIPDVAVQKASRASKSQPANVAVAEITEPTVVQVPMPMIVRQGFLEVREVATKEVVVAIELLSPVNKRNGKGRQTYESKRQKVLGSSTHLVEIDLLRAYDPMPVYSKGKKRDYRVLVSPSEMRPQAQLYSFGITEQAATFQLPLREGDVLPTVDLQALLNEVYDRFSYDLRLDYQLDSVPPLSEDVSSWADSLLKEKGLR